VFAAFTIGIDISLVISPRTMSILSPGELTAQADRFARSRLFVACTESIVQTIGPALPEFDPFRF